MTKRYKEAGKPTRRGLKSQWSKADQRRLSRVLGKNTKSNLPSPEELAKRHDIREKKYHLQYGF
jgi:hypothetical protein